MCALEPAQCIKRIANRYDNNRIEAWDAAVQKEFQGVCLAELLDLRIIRPQMVALCAHHVRTLGLNDWAIAPAAAKIYVLNGHWVGKNAT